MNGRAASNTSPQGPETTARLAGPWLGGSSRLSERCGRHCRKIRIDASGRVQRTRVRRRIGGGTWLVSKAALAMFLDGDVKALQAYHAGDRTGPIVMPYSNAWGKIFIACAEVSTGN